MEPLSAEELREAIALSSDMDYSSVIQLHDDELYASHVEDMATVINDLSQGLAEVRLHEGRRIAQFIHQSVPD